MKNFLIKVGLFFLIFFMFDKAFLLVEQISPEKEIDKRLEFVVKGEMNKDVIIVGSSRGARNIIAEQIESDTSLSTYNLSYPGSNIDFHEFIIRLLLKNNAPPKILILAMDEEAQFKLNNSIRFRYDRLYPLVKYEDILNELIIRGKKNKLLTDFFVLSRLNNSNFDLRKKEYTHLDTIRKCGSMPLSFQIKDYQFNYKKNELQYNPKDDSPLLLSAYSKIENLCKEHNIILLNAIPPNYRERSKSFERHIRKITNNSKTHFYNEQNPIYKVSSYYANFGHLNTKGAFIFTSEITELVNTIIDEIE